jgi:hypothetical protein
MKIGILTYHRVVNDGSVMQAYCGLKAISRQFPDARVEIIDYIPAKLWWTEHKKLIGKRPPFFRFGFWAKQKSLKQFIKNNLILSTETCITDHLHKACQFIENQSYDAVFVGSDTVWEARFSIYVPHPPNIYYLPKLKSAKKISYAASSDPLQPDFLSNEKTLHSISRHIKYFDYITVRDEATKDYLIEIGIQPEHIHFMPDPTLQYDFDELVQKPDIKKQRPWGGIAYGVKSVKEAAIAQLKSKGYDIVDFGNFTLNGRPIPGAVQSLNVRLGVFSMLDFLITDRFHSSIFTFKLTKAPVVFIEASQKWPDKNSKGRDLFHKLGSESMVWRYENGVDVPLDFIENYLKEWKDLSIDIEKKLLELQKRGLKQLTMVNEKLICE